MDYIYAALNEVCAECGYQLRWIWKRYSDADLAEFYETHVCKRCSAKQEG